MGFLDRISSEFDDIQNRSFNAQFGGGCPICKGVNTLDRRKVEREMHAVCVKCGAVFKGVLPYGVKMVEGDERYVDKIFPANVWRIIRLLADEDCILAMYSEKFVNFYATTVGVVREFKGVDFLSYGDISDIPLIKVWGVGILHIIGFFVFLFFGALTGLLMGPSLLVQGGFVIPVAILGIGFIPLIMARKKVYQIESPLLPEKESKNWRLKKTRSGGVKNFVSVVSEHLGML